MSVFFIALVFGIIIGLVIAIIFYITGGDD